MTVHHNKRKQRGGMSSVLGLPTYSNMTSTFNPALGPRLAWEENSGVPSFMPDMSTIPKWKEPSHPSRLTFEDPFSDKFAINTTSLPPEVKQTSVALDIAPTDFSSLQQMLSSTLNYNTVTSGAMTAQDLDGFPGIEDADAMSPAGGVQEYYNQYKTLIKDTTTYIQTVGSESAHVIKAKIDQVLDVFMKLPVSASEIIDMKNLVDKATVALEGTKTSAIDVTAPYVKSIRQKSIEAVNNGRVFVSDKMLEVQRNIQNAGKVTQDSVRNLAQMYNDLEVMAIVEPKYQYAAGQLFWLKEIAKSKLDKGGEHVQTVLSILQEYGLSALEHVREIQSGVEVSMSHTIGVTSNAASAAKDFLVDVAKNTKTESDALRSQFYGNVPQFFTQRGIDSMAGFSKSKLQSTSNFVKGVQAESDAMRSQFYGSLPVLSRKAAQSTYNIASSGLQSTTDFAKGVQNEADMMRIRLWESVGDILLKEGKPKVKYAQEQFKLGTEWSQALYMANETTMHFASVTGILSLVTISSFFFSRYLKSKYSIPKDRTVVGAHFTVRNHRYHLVANLDDGSNLSKEISNPDTLLRTASNEDALILDETPLDVPENKMAVLSNSSGEIVDAVLKDKPDVVKDTVRYMMQYPVVGAQALTQLSTSKNNDNVFITSYKLPVSLSMSATTQKSPLRYVERPGIRKAQNVSTMIPKKQFKELLVNQVIDKVKSADSKLISEALTDVDKTTQNAVVELFRDGNPAEIKDTLESKDAQSEQVSKVLKTIALVEDANKIKRSSRSDVHNVLSNLYPDIQNEVNALIQDSKPVELAKMMAKPNVNDTDEKVKNALSTLSIIPTVNSMKNVNRQKIKGETSQKYPKIIQDELLRTLDQAPVLTIADLMVKPAENDLNDQLKSALLDVAASVGKFTTRLNVKDVKDSVDAIVNAQVAQNAVTASPEMVKTVVENIPDDVKLDIARALRMDINIIQGTNKTVDAYVQSGVVTTVPTGFQSGIATSSQNKSIPISSLSIPSSKGSLKTVDVNSNFVKQLQKVDPVQIAKIFVGTDNSEKQTNVKKALQAITTHYVVPAMVDKQEDDAEKVTATATKIFNMIPNLRKESRNRNLRSRRRRSSSISSRKRCPNGSRKATRTKRSSSSGRSRTETYCKKMNKSKKSRSRSVSRSRNSRSTSKSRHSRSRNSRSTSRSRPKTRTDSTVYVNSQGCLCERKCKCKKSKNSNVSYKI